MLPVVGCCNSPPNLVVITQYLPHGSLFNMLHQESNIVVETAQVLKFALDIAKGMAFIHSLERLVPNLYLSSKHVMVSWVLDDAGGGCEMDFRFWLLLSSMHQVDPEPPPSLL